MNTTRPFASYPQSGVSLFEIVLALAVILGMSYFTWSMFSAMPAYGGQLPEPVVPVSMQLPPLQPLCWDKSREQAMAGDIEPGCPTDPMKYNPGRPNHS